MLIWERSVNLVKIKFLNFKLFILTIFLKAIFLVERNSADSFSISIQSCFKSKVFLNKRFNISDLKGVKKNCNLFQMHVAPLLCMSQ